jgi:hypothetical protein
LNLQWTFTGRPCRRDASSNNLLLPIGPTNLLVPRILQSPSPLAGEDRDGVSFKSLSYLQRKDKASINGIDDILAAVAAVAYLIGYRNYVGEFVHPVLFNLYS